jgi:hypothetical protein
MTLRLKRIWYKDVGIFGELTSVTDKHYCYTLEHSYNKLPKLPNGSYTCKRGTHQLHSGAPFETFEVTGVPGHTGILFHKGNTQADSEGCILLGQNMTADAVTESKLAFEAFLLLTKGAESFTLIVKDGVTCAISTS